uniref:Uncharacterized protein n=1 Tax=Avena sativa TaxID=4498 RepID=A0ACD5YTC1_AVESA
MDALVSAALEEVCARLSHGIPVTELWPALRGALEAAGLPLGPAVKRVLWARLLALPVVSLVAGDGSPLAPGDTADDLEEAERRGVRLLSSAAIRDNFLGMYDQRFAKSELSAVQKTALELIGASRTSGVTQKDLCKTFDMKGNNFHFIVKSLASQRLIVRQSTIIKVKDNGADGEETLRNKQVTNTNSLYLSRYAKDMNMNSHQRIEITKPELPGINEETNIDALQEEGAFGENFKNDISVHDYLPAMEAICDKLENASGKALVVSDIKVDLDYKMARGHRAWRNVLHRLRDAHLVEEFNAKVGDKVVRCLRLLKKFDPVEFQPKSTAPDYKIGQKHQATDQVMELPLDICIYDMIQAQGSKGITLVELGKRLGHKNSRRLHKRVSSMRQRFNLVWDAEVTDKTSQYRVWTKKDFLHYKSGTALQSLEGLPDENASCPDLWSLVPSRGPDSPHGALVNNKLMFEEECNDESVLQSNHEACAGVSQLVKQVVGSSKKIDNMITKVLSEIPTKEYNQLMDTHAKGRLSRLINILDKLKLVQFAKEPVDEWGVPSDAVPTHAMELRPYIEEPIRRILPSSHVNMNHRPKIRHDFVLSKQEFVDAYWETLEYCYLIAGFAEPLSAFPGCSVPEVLCVTSSQNRQPRFPATQKQQGASSGSICKKRKRSSNKVTLRFIKQKLQASGPAGKTPDQSTQDEEAAGTISASPTGKRFQWTYESNRKLLMTYTRFCAARGPKCYWNSISGLPAAPHTCRKRMAYLNKNINVRKAVVRICSLLREERRLKVRGCNSYISDSSHGNCEDSDSGIVNWDYFEDPEIKSALDEVLEFIQVEKLNQTREVGPDNNAKSNNDNNVNEEIPSGQEELVMQGATSTSIAIPETGSREHAKLSRHSNASLASKSVDVPRISHEKVIKVNAYDGFKIVDSLHKSKYHISTLAEFRHCSCSRDPATQLVETGGTENVLKEKHAMSSKQETVKLLGDGHTVTVLSVQSNSTSSHTCSQNPGDKEAMSTPQDSRESDCCHACERHIYHPILPWINGDGRMNSTVYEGLTRRIIGYVMQYPGVVEEDVIHQMEVLNPQTCRTLLEKLTFDRHLYVRVSEEPVPTAPTMLQSLFSQDSSTKPSKLRRRYFANPASTSML